MNIARMSVCQEAIAEATAAKSAQISINSA
jgi:hypothetical protein